MLYGPAFLTLPVRAIWCCGLVVAGGTCNTNIARSTYRRSALGNNLGQVVYTHVNLSSNGIIWFQSTDNVVVRG